MAFAMVAQEGNLTRAAERLYLSVPAASAQIKALEEELGVRLFERTPKGMFVTAAGRTLLDEAEHTLRAAERIKRAADDVKGRIAARIRVGALCDSVPLRVGDALLALGLRHPNIEVALHQDASGQVLNRVRGGDLDGGYALVDAAPEDLAADRLAPIELAVALPMRFAAQAASLSRAEVVGLPWIVSVPACALHAATLDLFRDSGRAPEARYVADSDGVLRSMIGSGLGAGILRRSEAEAGERAGEMTIWPHWRGSTWLCWVQAAANASPAVAAMREVVGESWRAAAA